MIPYGRQAVDDDDIAAVVAVLKGDWLTQGPHVEEFEAALARSAGAKHAVAYSSGTAGLHAAMAAAGIGPGHRCLTTPLSFAASASCARYVGADVGFVDVDAATWNMRTDDLPDCDALVAVHYAGLPVRLAELGHRPRVVIEDAAHAIGAMTPDGPVGNCAHSDMTVFSFHPVKTVTTGEGGAVTTNDDGLAARLRRFRTHGIERRPDQGGWFYEIAELAPNYRMTDMQAALGTSQLAKLERFVARRQALAGRYRTLLRDLPITLPPEASPGYTHAHHLFPVLVPRRRQVYDALQAAGVGTQVHYVPIYHHPLYAALVPDRSRFPETERVYAGLLSLPLFPALTDAQQDHVVAALTSALQEAA